MFALMNLPECFYFWPNGPQAAVNSMLDILISLWNLPATNKVPTFYPDEDDLQIASLLGAWVHKAYYLHVSSTDCHWQMNDNWQSREAVKHILSNSKSACL